MKILTANTELEEIYKSAPSAVVVEDDEA